MLEQESNIPQSDRDFKVEGNAELKSEHEVLFIKLSDKLDQIGDVVHFSLTEIANKVGEANSSGAVTGERETIVEEMRDKVEKEKLRPLVQEARALIEEIRTFERERMSTTEDSEKLKRDIDWVESLAEEGWKIN